MSQQTLAYCALALVLAILAVALLARRTPVAADEVTVTLEDLMRPTVHGVNGLAYCPAEERTTLHLFVLGSRTCWTCRCETPTAVPRG